MNKIITINFKEALTDYGMSRTWQAVGFMGKDEATRISDKAKEQELFNMCLKMFEDAITSFVPVVQIVTRVKSIYSGAPCLRFREGTTPYQRIEAMKKV